MHRDPEPLLDLRTEVDALVAVLAAKARFPQTRAREEVDLEYARAQEGLEALPQEAAAWARAGRRWQRRARWRLRLWILGMRMRGVRPPQQAKT